MQMSDEVVIKPAVISEHRVYPMLRPDVADGIQRLWINAVSSMFNNGTLNVAIVGHGEPRHYVISTGHYIDDPVGEFLVSTFWKDVDMVAGRSKYFNILSDARLHVYQHGLLPARFKPTVWYKPFEIKAKGKK